MKITIEQYKDAILNALSEKQIEILQLLFEFPFSQATVQELANILSPKNPHIIIANNQIGKIGKAIADYLSIIIGSHAFPKCYLIIGEYYFEKGWKMQPNLRKAMKLLNLATQRVKYNPDVSANDEEQQVYIEGTPNQIVQTRYERNPFARKKCIEHYGNSCVVCSFNFEKTYGKIGKDFIHVHHLQQVATVGKSYQINPIKDLRPVCPNCHAIIHRNKQPLTIEEITNLIKQKK